MSGRALSPALAEIERLDPRTDFERITFLSSCLDFPWDTERALEVALFRTYCVPSISELLARTREFLDRPQKRYDDTELILSELLESGLDSERGREAQRRMNRMHHQFDIANDDYLFVLSTFVFLPLRWNRRFGWRHHTEKEREAHFRYWRQIGHRMNIHSIPESLEGFEAWAEEYERARFERAESNRAVADSTLRMFLQRYPAPLRPLVRAGVIALLDEPALRAFGYSPQPRWVVSLVEGLLRMRAWMVRLLPRRRTPRLITKRRNPTYPRGYRVEELGARPPEWLEQKPGGRQAGG